MFYFQDAIDESSSMDGEDTLVVDEIPGSTILWEVTPRPSNSSNVSILEITFLQILNNFMFHKFLHVHSHSYI